MSSKNIKGITIEIDGATSNLDKALKATTDKSVALNTELKDINKNLKFDPSNTTLLSQKQKVLNDAIKNTSEHLQTLKSAQEQVQAQFDRGEITEEQYRAFQREIASTERSLRTYTSEVKQTTVAQQQMSAATKAAYDQLDRAATVGLTIGIAALGAIALGTKAVAKGLYKTVEAGADFKKSMDAVNTLDLSASAQKMEKITKAVLKNSSDMGIAAKETADATYQMASAVGYLDSKVGDYVGVATKSAIGGFTDTKTAVNVLTTVMNSYGEQTVKAMTKFSDQMLTAQNLGKTTFGEIAESLGRVVPIAAQLNITTEELFASYAVLTKNGIATREATTGLKAVISNIIKPTSEATKKAKELGIEFNATALESKGLYGMLLEVMTATNGSAEDLAKLFGSVEALNAAMVFASERGMSDYADTITKMQSAAGATEAAFLKMTDNVDAAQKRMVTSADNIKIAWGTELEGSAKRSMNAITKAINAVAANKEAAQAIKSLGESFENAITKIAAKTEKEIPKIVKGISWLIDNGEELIATTVGLTAAFATAKAGFAITKIVYSATTAFAAYKAAQIAGAAATGTATAAQLGFNAALMANPAGLIATAIATLIAGVATYAIICPKAQTETQKLNAELKDLHEEIASSKQAYDESVSSLQSEAIASAALVSRLEELTSKTTLTAAEQAELDAIVQKLNDSYDGLNLAYDKQTKTLNKTITSIKDYTKTKYAEAKAAVATERAIELIDQQTKAQANLDKVNAAVIRTEKELLELQTAYNNALAAGADGRAVATEYGQKLVQATNAFETATETANKYAAELDSVNQSMAQNGIALEGYLTDSGQYTAATESAADATERFKWRSYDLQKVLDDTGLSADEAAAKLDAYAAITQNAFELIESTVNLTASEITKNLLGNTANMETWLENLETLAARTTTAGDTIDSGFVQMLRDMELTAAGTVANLASASQSDFDALASAWEAGGDAAVKALLKEMGAGEAEIQDASGKAIQDAIDGLQAKQTELDTAVSKVITDSRTKAFESVTSAKFDKVGYQMTAGIAKGVREGVGILKDAIDYIIDEAIKEARRKAIIKSPSGLFEDKVGFDMGRGVGSGIYSAMDYIKDMIDRTITSSANYASRIIPKPATPAAAQAGATYNLSISIYSHDQLSPSEIMDEAKEFLRSVTQI